MGIEPMTPVLPRLCATSAPHGPTLPYSYINKAHHTLLTHICIGGQWRIRTSEALATDLQSVPFVHFGNCPG